MNEKQATTRRSVGRGIRWPIVLAGMMLTMSISATPRVADAQSSGYSAIACDSYARSYAQNNSSQGQMLRGAAKGSLLGLGIGAIAGGAGAGAAIGATVGLIGGGAKRNATAGRMYDVAYQDCMAGRIR